MSDITPTIVVPIDRAQDHYPPAPRVGDVFGSGFVSQIGARMAATDGRLVIFSDSCRASKWRILAKRAKYPHEVPHETHEYLRRYLDDWQAAIEEADTWQPTHVTGSPSTWADGCPVLARVTDGRVEQYGVDLARHRYLLAALKGLARVVSLPRGSFGYVGKGGQLLAACMAVRML